MAPKKTLENPNPKNNNDPFTDLPDCIIHHIFSFLDTNNVVSMRAVSKRLLQVCTSSPYLSFTSKPCDRHIPSERCKQFREFLDRFWSDRGSNIDAASIHITYLHIEWTCSKCKFDDGASMVLAWITKAVMFNVQEFHLKLGLKSVELPECVFNCKSLTVLNIKGRRVRLPRLVFHSLQVLSLNDPSVMNNNGYNEISIGEWISNSCPSLKKLSLKRLTDRNLIITSSSLEEVNVSGETDYSDSDYVINILMEKLNILSLDFPGWKYYDASMNNIVRIIAPNLHDFTFNAEFRECEFSGEYMSLHKASINVPADCNYLVALHRSISLATTLEVDLLALKNLFKNDGCRQLLIENLHYLTLKADTNSNDEYIPSLISFLKLLHNLKSLTIKHIWQRHGSQFATYDPPEKYTSDMEGNQPRNLMLFQSLKEVVIDIEVGTGTKEIGLIKYLLKHAQSLEKVTVLHANKLFYSALA